MDLAGDWLLLPAPAGLLIGAWAGLSGYSGWPLVVPVLLVVGGRPLHESLAASIFVDLANAVSAAVVYNVRGDADRATAGRWALATLPLALAGAGLSFSVLRRFEGLVGAGSGPIAMLLGAALLVRAVRLRAGARVAAVAGVPTASVGEGEAGRVPLSPRRARVLLSAGMGLTGAGMGFVGMGGGFTAAILLILLRGDGERSGVGTGLLFTALVLPVVLLAYLWMLPDGIGFWPLLLPFAACSALGAGVGAWQAGRIPSRHLGIVVGGCVLLVGVAATLQQWALA